MGVRLDYSHEGITLGNIFTPSHNDPVIGNLEHEEIDIGEKEPVRCVSQALWLLERNGLKLVVLLSPASKYGQVSGIRIEIGHLNDETGTKVAKDLFKALEHGIARSGTYRGKVLSLEVGDNYMGQASGLKVHALRPVARKDIILPETTIQLLDRNILRFANQRKELAARGLSAKKGLLFYGPPGTGKTMTLHYLIEALKGHTFLLVTAQQQGMIDEYILLARLLQPSVVVIEDADLIAKRREDMRNPCMESMLNMLLNELDGLRLDAEIFFILTTNRPEVLEPALIDRPGRIDQAIEFPLPDVSAREHLIRKYAGQMRIEPAIVASAANRANGVSGAFIKELMRRSVQYALEAGHMEEIAADDLESALQDMLHLRGSLSGRIVGIIDEN